MSGFVALAHLDGRPVDRDLLEELTGALRYRGPDATGTWIDGPVGLGHALFRTTREAAFEKQPCSLDGETWLVASARVDARDVLVDRLGAPALRLDATPDTELILRAWATWGEDALDRLQGDFAFALWDGRKRQLTCARDHFGMRGLYYAQVGPTLVVSNSLPCIRRHPDVSDRLDDQAVADFLLTGEHGWIDRSLTPYADVRMLPAAHALVLRDGRVTLRRYWEFPTEIPLLRARRDGDVIRRFRHVFRQAVEDRLRADRVVLALGGGVDSSSIAATVCDLQAEGRGPEALSAVSIAFDRLPLPRERPFVEATAAKLGIEVDYLVADDHALLDPPVDATAPMEFCQPAVNLEFLRRVATRGRVHLTGASGDSLLLGTPVLESVGDVGLSRAIRQVFALRSRYGAFPSLGTGLLARLRGGGASADGSEAAFPYPMWLAPELEASLDLRARWNAWWGETGEGDRTARVRDMLVTPQWCAEDLHRPDGFVQAEERDPFLDLRVVELVLSLPALPWLHQKHILRETLRERLPRAVLDRPKTVLGDVHEVLLEQPASSWIDTHELGPTLDRFVVRSRVPRPSAAGASPAERYVALRPLILDQWLRNPW